MKQAQLKLIILSSLNSAIFYSRTYLITERFILKTRKKIYPELNGILITLNPSMYH